jgi:rhamnulose-1-phosphate aldolase
MKTVDPHRPSLEKIIGEMGEAGKLLHTINACEGAVGNMSAYLGYTINPETVFPAREEIALPQAVPELAGGSLIVTGSGRRLRQIKDNPPLNLGCLTIHESGKTATLRTVPDRPFDRLTSELNSHLAVHRSRMTRDSIPFHAIVHAHPVHLNYLSHLPAYQDESYVNRRLFRWLPEPIITLPQGVGIAPFTTPGSDRLMRATLDALRTKSAVLWAKHGVVACSDGSVLQAVDIIELLEVSARYEYLDLVNGARAPGISAAEIRAMCAELGVKQEIY